MMIGQDYESFDDLIEAFKQGGTPLDAANVLAKIYSIDQLRFLAEANGLRREELTAVGREEDSETRRGIEQRYKYARAISQLLEPRQISESLSFCDHELCFPVITYFRLSDTAHRSADDMLEVLRTGYGIGAETFKELFDGLLEPAGPACKLESIRVNRADDIISLLFSCNRVLLVPDGRQGDFTNYFVARVPVLARFLFTNRLLEISMPVFSEVPGAGLGSPITIPERYQVIVRATLALLREIVPVFPTVNFGKVTLWLETEVKAIDMGWKIVPEDGSEFDFTQGVIPLRKILDSLSDSLREECRRRSLTYPPEWTDLYSIFRALKEQSRTETLVLQGPLGRRRGGVRTSTLYGKPNAGPPIMLLQKNDKFISSGLRDAVFLSQVTDVENPYDLNSIFKGYESR